MKTERAISALIIGCLIITSCRAAPSGLTEAGMHADVDYLVRTLLEVHPLTVEGFDPQQEAVIAQVRQQVRETGTSTEFLLLISQIAAALGDGHTAFRLQFRDRRVPLDLVWLADGLYVLRSRGQARAGERVVRIGSMTEAEILASLRKYISADNDHALRVMGERLLMQETMLRTLGLLEADGTVPVTLEGTEGVREVRMGLTEVPSSPPVLRPGRPWIGWEIEPEHGLGILHLDRCDPNREYDQVLQEFFTALAEGGVENIVVDLRYNPGGNSQVVNRFLRYLAVDTYRSFGMTIRYSQAASKQRGYKQISGQDSYPPLVLPNQKIEGLTFSGSIYVLISPRTFSSAVLFATVLADNGLATLVGEPTGNAPSSPGDILTFRLPHSGYSFTVSRKLFLRPRGDSCDDTLQPHVYVPTGIQDILSRRDPQLEAVRSLIARRTGN